MPEYLAPGVYVEEIDSDIREIPGVATSTAALESLAADLRRAIQAHAPEWTGRNESDPGVTLVNVFAFLADNLLFRASQIPERVRAAALRAAASLSALARAGEAGRETLKRPNYFSGRLLDASTLTAEQTYHREKLRRHNRALHGYGVVSGLAVRVADIVDSGGGHIVVEPGYAIDHNGEEMSVPVPVVLALPLQGDRAFVTLRYWENPGPPVPAPGDTASGAPWIEEACVLGIKPEAVSPAIALARLVRNDGRWQVDPA